MASRGGTVKVDENLEGRTLDILEKSDQWSFHIDGLEVICFTKDARLGVSMAYEITDENGYKVYTTTITPDDPAFPEAQESVLRYDLEWHLLEITFKGRIPLKFHSEREGFKYWCVDANTNTNTDDITYTKKQKRKRDRKKP